MCFIWEGSIVRCQKCSDTDYTTLLKLVLPVESIRQTYRLYGRTAQHDLTDGRKRPSRPSFHIDLPRNSMTETRFDREQVPTHHSQPSSSRRDDPINGTAQHKRQRTDTDHPPTVKRARRIDEQHQLPNQLSSFRQDARVHAAVQLGHQIQTHNQLAIARRNARSDLVNAHAQNQSHQDLPSSLRHHMITDVKAKDGVQDSSQHASHNDACQDDTEASTLRMAKLPRPCWEDREVMYSLVGEEMKLKDFLRIQDERLNKIWDGYAKERQALAAVHTPKAEEKEGWDWIPVTEHEVIVERERPLWDEIWERSMLGGEAQMRNILDEDETWPPKAPAEPNVWTREPGSMLTSPMLKQLLCVSVLQDHLQDQCGETG